VSTRFLHIMFFPFVPQSSWLEPNRDLDPSFGKRVAFPLPRIVWRSVLLAWIRGILVFAALIASLVLSVQVSLGRTPDSLLATVSVLVLCAVTYFCSYRFDHASVEEILEVLQASGMPPQVMAAARDRVQRLVAS
jgi:hypothetical protein